jgi:hypothetical protein
MKMQWLELQQHGRAGSQRGLALGTAWGTLRFAAVLAAVLLLACTFVRPKHWGDTIEYTLMTVAMANHASPDIRLDDVSEARGRLPDMAGYYDTIADGLRKGVEVPIPGLLRGADGRMYAIHFFAFPALAAVPFNLLRAVGRDPFRCYLAVNSAFVFALGLALYRLFGSAPRAALGLITYFLCGGLLYWQWSSPETMSAAGLLAGLIFYVTGMPILGGVLAGLGAMQNPPIVFFCAFAPLLRLAVTWGGERSPGRLWTLFGWRYVAGVLACAALFALNVLFNEAKFGTPSIIAKVSTSTNYITLNRLHSFFFDLNQGMILGVPAVAAALLLWPGLKRRALAVIAASCVFAVAMAGPSLVAQNWNSGAAGIMRYVLWASMPLLFAFLWRLRLAARWPAVLLTLVLAVQALAMYHAGRYSEVTFSPLARQVMGTAPGWYNPDPEIFYDRASGAESWPMPEKVFSFPANGSPAVKTLYNVSNQKVGEQLCGAGRALAPENRYVDADLGWRYINGPVRCTPAH